VADADVQRSLAELPTQRFPELGSTTAHEPEGRGRYLLTRLHASGGIGQVWLARDRSLGRDVALKELRPERQEQPVVQARFLEEARITGQLEHPGIVPVHELVHGDDGRSFYTMRMVRGRTLAEAIKAYHRERQAGQAQSLELRALLSAFVAVCNAVAYAHSRGVIHRDLKPANVVLGDYGEVVVLDWGLAKLLGEQCAGPPVVEASSLLPVSLEPGSHDETVQGQVLGTPGYMAPEQAEGRLDLLGPGTDVYGLGAVLYELLTGVAPFTGGPNDEILRRVLREEPERPRRRVPATSRSLEAICMKALAKKPSHRYATAGELAKEVERWLGDEPVNALREPWRLRAGRWVRRHQSLVSALAASVLVLLMLGGAGVAWLSGERERQGAAVESALGRVAALQEEARWEEARGVAEQAESRLGKFSPAGLRRRLAQARADLDLVARLDAIRLERINVVEGGMLDRAGTNLKYAEAFAEAGLGKVGDDEVEVARRVAGSAVRQALVAALDDWADHTQDKSSLVWVLGVARRADPHPWRDRLRDPVLWKDLTRLARLVRQAPVGEMTVPLAVALGSGLARHEEGETLLRQLHQSNPGDFWLNYTLGSVLFRRARNQEAEAYCRAALALRPKSPPVLTLLGAVLDRQGKWEESEKCDRRAIELDPGYAISYSNLGWYLWERQKKPAEAEKYFRKAIDLGPKLAQPHSSLAKLLDWRGMRAEAERYHRKAIELDPRDATNYQALANCLEKQGKKAEALAVWHKLPALRPTDPWAYHNLGAALERQGKWAEAEVVYRKLIVLDPKAHGQLGLALEKQGKLSEAEAAFRKLILLEPKSAPAHDGLGWFLKNHGTLAESEKLFRKAIELDPNSPAANYHLRDLLYQQGKVAEAETTFREVVERYPTSDTAHECLYSVLIRRGKHADAETIFRQAVERDPKSLVFRRTLGDVLVRQRKWALAEPIYRKLVELDPGDGAAHARLAEVLKGQQKWVEAEKHCRKVIELGHESRDANRLAMHHNALGEVLEPQGKLSEAEKYFRKAIELNSKWVIPEINLVRVLFRQERHAELEEHCRKAIESNPKSAWSHANLGWVRGQQGKWVEAEKLYRKASELDPKSPQIRARLGFASQMAELEPKLTAWLERKYQPDNNGERLQLVSLCRQKRLYRAAAALYTEAFAADTKLVEDPTKRFLRYSAACNAALAGCGKGEDAGKLDEQERARLRDQALTWLQAELPLWGKQLENDKSVDRAMVQGWMRHWLTNEDFAGVRGKEAIEKLPVAERQAWGKLWQDVAALVARAGGK
jgi:serine/threonine-protein kinase